MEFVKAEIGDRIRMIGDIGGHIPEYEIGDIQTVVDTDYTCIETDAGNVFYDDDEEYEIVGEE